MLHQLGSVYDRTPEFLLEVEELHKVCKMITRVYALRTDKPFWVVSKDMERDVFISGDEEKAYGLVDKFSFKYLYILVSQNTTISNHLSLKLDSIIFT
jgi:ATP-dependent protease ClpP protease subunit